MKIPFAITTLTAVLLGCGCALAQMGGTSTSPGNIATPLALGPVAPVGPSGVPLGATELAAPGTSPAPPSTMGCSNAAGSTSQAGMALFDGGGMTSSACAGIGGAGAAIAGSSPPPPSTL